MRQSKTTLKELTAAYRAVLRYGILCNAIALGLCIAPAGAENIVKVGSETAPQIINVGGEKQDGGWALLYNMTKGTATYNPDTHVIDVVADANNEISAQNFWASIQTFNPEHVHPQVNVYGDSDTVVNMSALENDWLIVSRFAPVNIGTEQSAIGTLNLTNEYLATDPDDEGSLIYVTSGNGAADADRQDLRIYADNVTMVAKHDDGSRGVAITGNEGKMTLVANNNLNITGNIEGYNTVYGGHSDMTFDINQNAGNTAKTTIVGNINAAKGSNVNIGLKGAESSITGDMLVSADGSLLPGGNINLSFGNDGSITGNMTAQDRGTINIDADSELDVNGNILVNADSSFNGKNINLTATSGKALKASGANAVATLTGDTTVNSNDTSIRADNGGKVDVSGDNVNLYARDNIAVLALAQGAQVNINGSDVRIATSNEDWAAVHAGNNTTDSTGPLANVNINADTINIKAEDGEGNAIGKAIGAMSQGIVNINGDTTIKAKDAIVARGGAQVYINKDTDNSLVMDGDIDFDYDKATSGTVVDAIVDVTLSGNDSRWTGNTVASYNTGEAPDESYMRVNSASLTMKDGATWNATAVEPFHNDMAGVGYVAMNNLNIDNSTVNIADAINGLFVDNLVANNLTINGDGISTGKMTVNRTVNTMNNKIDNHGGKLFLADGTNVKADFGLSNGTKDDFTANGGLTLSGFGVTSDSDTTTTDIAVAHAGDTVDVADGLRAYTTTAKYTAAALTGENAHMVQFTKDTSGDVGLKAAAADTAAGQVTYTLTADDTSVNTNTQIAATDMLIKGAGTGAGDNSVTLGAKLAVAENSAVTIEDAKFEGTGSLDNASGAELTVNGSSLDVDVTNAGEATVTDTTLAAGKTVENKVGATMTILDSQVLANLKNYGTLVSDPTDYYATVDNEGVASFDADTFHNTSILANKGVATLTNGVTFDTDAQITQKGTLNLAGGTTHFNNTASSNNVKLASGADFDGTLASTGTLDTRNSTIDTVTGSVSGGDLYVDAKLGNTNTIDTLGGVSGATVKEINVLGAEYGTDESATLALGAGATLDPNVQVNGMNYYTNMAYDSTSGDLTFSDKLVNTSGLYDKLGANWTGGTYIKNAANYTNAADATHLTVGQALSALDTQVATNTSTIATKQDALNAGDITTTLIADKAVTSDKLSDAVNASLALANSALQSHQTIAEGSTNGTISVGGADVAVHGLGSAAYTNSGAYATAAQGAKADTALQSTSALNGANLTDGTVAKAALASGVQASLDKADTALQSTSALNGANLTAGTVAKTALASGVQASLDKADTALQSADLAGYATEAYVQDGSHLTAGTVAKTALASGVQASLALADSSVQSVVEGTTNGTIKVDGVDVAVHGLGTAAYTSADAYATAAQGAKADTALQATSALNGANLTDGTVAKAALASGVQASLDKADTALQSTSALNGANLTDGTVAQAALSAEVQTLLGKANTALQSADLTGYATEAYAQDGSHLSDGTVAKAALASGVQASLDKADTALQSTSALNGANLTDGTVAKTALASDVQTSLGKADTALQSNSDALTDKSLNIDAASLKVNGSDVLTSANLSTSVETAVNTAVSGVTTMQAHTQEQIDAGQGYVNFGEGDSVTTAVAALDTAVATLDAHTGRVHGLISQTGETKTFNGTTSTSTNKDSSGNYVGNLAVGTTTEDHLVALDNAIGSLSTLDTTNGVLDNNASVAANLQNLDTALNNVRTATAANNQLVLNQAVAYTDERVDRLDKELSSGIASAVALSSVAVSDVNRGEVSVGAGYGYYNGRSAAAFGAAMGLTNRWSVNAGAGVSDADVSFRAGTNYKFKLF